MSALECRRHFSTFLGQFEGAKSEFFGYPSSILDILVHTYLTQLLNYCYVPIKIAISMLYRLVHVWVGETKLYDT